MGAHVAPTGKNIMWEHTGENILGQKTWSTGGSYREEHHVGTQREEHPWTKDMEHRWLLQGRTSCRNTQGRTSLERGHGAQVAPTGKNIMWEHRGKNIPGQRTWGTGGSYREKHHVGTHRGEHPWKEDMGHRWLLQGKTSCGNTEGRTSFDRGHGAQVAPTGKNIM